jgi:4-amino-4-deoxy-L-arabinose transferase-like glycosyltransferase
MKAAPNSDAQRSSRSERRRNAAAGATLFVFALLVTIWVSAHTGPAFDELARLRAENAMQAVVRHIASSGVAALAAPSSQAAYAAFHGRGTLLVLLSAWSRLSIGRVGLLDSLSAARLPWLMLSALSALLVYVLALPSLGRRTALLAGLLLALTPRWVHAAAVSSSGVAATACWLFVMASYIRSLGPARAGLNQKTNTLGWGLLAAAATGFGLAVSSATLWALAIVVLHFWLARHRSTRRLLKRGRVPVPPFVLFAIFIAPVACVLFNPALWRIRIVSIARWLLAPLAPSVAATQYAGQLVDGPPVPGGYAARWLVETLPAVLLACALVGLGVLAHRALARRFATGSLRPPRDRHALGTLIGLCLAFTVLGPFVRPAVLTTFPPRVELALPFVALSAAIGLERAARAAAGARFAAWAEFATAALVGALAVYAPSTLSASFDELLGGASRAVHVGVFAVGDGSELGPLAHDIDTLGRSQVSLLAPGVPPDLWNALRDAGWLRTAVVTAPLDRPGDLLLERGRRTGRPLFEVERDGAPLWALREAR